MTHLRQGRPERFTAGLDALVVAGWIRRGTFTELESILRAQGMDVHARQLAGFGDQPPRAAPPRQPEPHVRAHGLC